MPSDSYQLMLDGLTDAPRVDELARIEAAAASIAAEAGELLLDRFRSVLEVQYKDEHRSDPVTEVDHAVEALVQRTVQEQFPDHGLLGEEGGDIDPAGRDYVWIVDPLDGTSNFISGMATFACSIGVVWRGIPVVGALFLPTNRHLQPGVYRGHMGGGVHFDDVPFHFQLADAPASARLSAIPGGTGGVTGPKGRRFGVARTMGSVAAELVYTAEGTFQMAMFEGAKVWDVAGGIALCLEAGASVYVRAGKSAPWRPLERFAGADSAPPDIAQLRAWNEAVAVGAAEVLPDLARDLQKEQRLLAVLRRLILREGDG